MSRVCCPPSLNGDPTGAVTAQGPSDVPNVPVLLFHCLASLGARSLHLYLAPVAALDFVPSGGDRAPPRPLLPPVLLHPSSERKD